MNKIVSVSLENELDIPLSHKRTAKVATLLGLTLSTQTTFAAGISETARVVIERTMNSILEIGLQNEGNRWFLYGKVISDAVELNNNDFVYARRLVPALEIEKKEGKVILLVKMGLPRSIEINKSRINSLTDYFETTLPDSPYEEIKRRNRQLNEIVEEREEQLRISNYLNEQKAEFLSIASHELKTPLSVIKAYTQLAQSGKSTKININDMLEKISNQTAKMHTLILQLLDIAKIENKSIVYNMEEVNVQEFLNDIAATISAIYPEHAIKLDLETTQRIKIDRLRIEQVLINIMGNAAKYSKSGSTINVKVAGDDDATLISVKDRGIGLSPESLEKVFDKFYRVGDIQKTHPGLGMGLYIASKIIEGHKGKIWAESTLDEGSTFYFSIPNQASGTIVQAG